MKRVLVIGCGGAGKSTFSRALSERTGLPVIHLDAHFWRPGWVQPSSEDWAAQVEELLARPRWIMDGNYGGTLPARLEACDTVVFLDRPRLLCIWRVIRRRVVYHGIVRPDLAAGCEERLDLAFLHYLWRYPATRRPKILARLAALRPAQRAIHLKTEREMKDFLDTVAK